MAKTIPQKKLQDSKWIKLSNETLYDYLKRLLKQIIAIKWLNIIMLFLAIPGAIASGIGLYERCSNTQKVENKIEILRDSVMRNISIIEETFHPEEITAEFDTSINNGVYKIKKFKILSIELSNAMRELYNTPMVSSFKDKELMEIMDLGKNWDEKRHACKELSRKLFDVILELDSLGKERHINGYIINLPLYQTILDGDEESDKYSDKLKEQALQIHNNAMGKMGKYEKYYSEINKDDLIKIISLQEQSWDNEIVHRNENRILMFIINQNKNYDVVLKSFNQNN